MEYDDPEYDIDDSVIEPKSRVHQWATGILATKERHKIKRTWHKMLQAEVESPKENEDPIWAADKRSILPMQAGKSAHMWRIRADGREYDASSCFFCEVPAVFESTRQ